MQKLASGNISRTEAVLRLDGVYKSFTSHRVLDNINLHLAAGEVYAMLGPNGAGKTTTLNLILGFTAPDAGHIEVAGIDAVRAPLAARAKLAYLPETVMLHPVLSAVDNLKYFALLGGRHLSSTEAHRLLIDAGLQEPAFELRAGGFSKGMRQKVGLAIALAKNAQLLLLDEPTSGLDARAANEFAHLVRTASTRNLAVLMVTHDLFRIRDTAHRLGILHGGKLVAERHTAELSSIDIESLYLEQLGV